MTPRVSSRHGRVKSNRKQTQAVTRRPKAQRAASLGFVLRVVLWTGFFVALFTAHAHVRIRTAMLRTEASRIERTIEDLRDQRRQCRSDLSPVLDSARLERIAQDELGMVESPAADRLVVTRAIVEEVAETADLWTHRPAVETDPADRADWVEILAGLVAGQREITG